MEKIHAISSLTISKLAQTAGVGVETVRFYQRRGLINIPHASSGYRTYTEQDIERLRFIKRAQTIGFSLDEIVELLQLNDTRDHLTARTLGLSKIADIETRIEQLNHIAEALRHLVNECQQGEMNVPCPIIRMSMAKECGD